MSRTRSRSIQSKELSIEKTSSHDQSDLEHDVSRVLTGQHIDDQYVYHETEDQLNKPDEGEGIKDDNEKNLEETQARGEGTTGSLDQDVEKGEQEVIAEESAQIIRDPNLVRYR